MTSVVPALQTQLVKAKPQVKQPFDLSPSAGQHSTLCFTLFVSFFAFVDLHEQSSREVDVHS